MNNTEVIAKLYQLEKIPFISPEYNEAIKIGLDAVQREEKREQGCPWCMETATKPAKKMHINGSLDTVNHGGYIDRDVKYCPMCGRKLESEVQNG